MYEAQIGGTGANFRTFDVQPNGVRKIFTLLDGAFIASTARLWLEGVLMIEGATADFTMVGATGKFTFETAPAAGVLSASYQRKLGRRIDQSRGTSDTYGVITPEPNGIVVDFYTQIPYKSSTLIPFVNGQRATQGSAGNNDYNESDYTLGKFTFEVAPLATDELTAEYEPEE